MNETNSISKSERIFYYDVLRAIAIIGIIFCHVSNIYVSRDINSPSLYISAFFDCFRDFSIPIFVMLSGALLIGKKDSLMKFYKKRLSRLFIPFLFWFLVYVTFIIAIISHNFNLDNAIKIFFGTGGTLGVHFWFVWMIIIVYIGIYLINKVMETGTDRIDNFNSKFITILAIVSVIYITTIHYHLLNPYNDKLTYYLSFLTYIIIGYFISKSNFLGDRIKTNYLIIITGTLFMGPYIWYIISFVVPRTHMAHTFVTLGYFNLAILFMSVNAFLFFKYLSKTKRFEEMKNNALGKFFTITSNYSYGIYLIHYLVLARIKINLIKYLNFIQGNPLIWIPTLVIATIAVSLAILAILDKVPYLDKVTGKK